MRATAKNLQILVDRINEGLPENASSYYTISLCYEDTCIVYETPNDRVSGGWSKFTGPQREAMRWLQGMLFGMAQGE